MTIYTTVVLLALAAAAVAAPLGGDTPRCSTECPVAAAKLSYIPSKTYSYTYSGVYKVQLTGVEGGVTETKPESKVMLTWLSPCDVAISFKEIKVDGEGGISAAKQLEKYPLVAAVTDGRVQRVCSHPDDDTWAINIKKGIASTIQNSLPSLSAISLGLNFTETDVVGTCPTTYEVQGEGGRVVVRKEKNHRLCQERYSTPDEIDLPWLKGPLPIQESWSVCTQDINNGIYSSITCKDKKVVRPFYGAYKFVEAEQESTLRLISDDAPTPDTISTISQAQLVPRSLRYDYETPKKNPSLVPQLEQTLRHICQITEHTVEAMSAIVLEKAVHLMRRVPDQSLSEIYNKVVSGQLCPSNTKLKSLFLDAVSFVHESGSVPIMVKELVEGRATEGRAGLYSAALYLTPRPCIHAIEALQPLFESNQQNLSLPWLAAASMVNKYCRHNPRGYNEASVRSLPQALVRKIEKDLSASSTEETQKEALAALKALGNMGVMTPEVSSSVLRYMKQDTKKTNIRIAAAQAFRLAKCERSVTHQLIDFALHPGKDTEVRIASYLTAVRCAHYEDLQNIVGNITTQENTQVRGFILSHLLNLQKSDSPEKERLRYLLANIVIPRDFEADLRKYSRNIDLSYFAPSLGLGAEVESNLIYAPGSFIPRSLDLNLTAALQGISMNFGEFGARLEGLEPIIAKIFGPGGYIRSSSYNKLFNDIVSFAQKNWNKIKEVLETSLRQRRSVDYSVLRDIISKLYDPQSIPVHADVFARFMGQEINFASVSKHLQDILSTGASIDDLIRYIINILTKMKNMNVDTARAAHLEMDYSFPTIQGTPLKVTMDAAVVAGLKMKTNLNDLLSGQSSSGNAFKISPSLSVQAIGFVGYDAYLYKTGLKINTTVSSSNVVSVKVNTQGNQELQIELELPDKMEIVNVESETFLMKKKNGQPEQKILPPSMRDIRIIKKSCDDGLLESLLGLKMCYDINLPDPLRSNSLPLGQPSIVKLYLEKAESSIRGYKITGSKKSEPQSIQYSSKFSVDGSSSPREADVAVLLKKEGQSYIASVKLHSATAEGQIQSTITNRPDYKSMQAAVALKTSDIEVSRGIKIDLKILPGDTEKKYELNVYSSNSGQFPQESIVFTSEFKKTFRSPQLSLDFSAKTKNVLSQYLPFNFEVGGDLQYGPHSVVPLPLRLRKLEFEVDLLRWKIISFVHKSGGSGQATEYSSVLKMVRNDQDVIHLQADLHLQGTPAIDFAARILTKAKLGESEYKMEQVLEYQQTRMAANLQVIRSSDNVKLLEIIALKDSQEIKFLFHVEVPEYVRVFKIAAQASQRGQDYMLEVAIMHGQQRLLELHGPVTFINSLYLTKLKTDIIINHSYQLISDIESAIDKQIISITVKKQQDILTKLEWNMHSKPSQGPTLQAKLLLPALVDAQIEALLRQNVIHASTNTLLIPQSPSSRRIKAFIDINLDNKQGQLSVLWDADHDATKKVTLDAVLVPDTGRPAQASIHGNIVWKTETYKFIMKVAAPVLVQQYGENKFSLEMTTPTQKTWKVEVETQEQPGSSVSVVLAFTSINNAKYHLASELRWNRLRGHTDLTLKSEMRYTSPEGHNTQLSVEMRHSDLREACVLVFKIDVLTSSSNKPMSVTFSVEIKDYSRSMKLQTDIDGPKTLFSWLLEIFPEGGVKTLDSSIDLKAVKDVLDVIRKMLEPSSGSVSLISEFGDERSTIHSRYSRMSSATHSVMIQLPSRTVEAEGTYSPSEMGFRLYPNRAESEGKYEVSARYSQNLWTGTSRYEGKVSHPSLIRDMKAVVEYTGTGNTQKGSLELDMFPDTTDKITGSLTSILLANNTVRVEATLSTRVLQVKPNVTLEVSWAPHTAAIDFRFRKTASSPESFKLMAKYDRISKRAAALAFQLVTQHGPVVDVSGVVEPQRDPECNGFKLHASARTSVLDNIVINSTLCRPALLKLDVTKQGGYRTYITKIGLQTPDNAEISLSEADVLQVWKKPLSMVGIRLKSRSRVKIDFEWKPEEMSSMKDFVLREKDRVREAISAWMDEVYREIEKEAQKQGVPFPNPEIHKLMKEAKKDLVLIYQELVNEILRPQWEAFLRILHGPIGTAIREVVYKILSDLEQKQKDWAHHIDTYLIDWKEKLTSTIVRIIKGVNDIMTWMETGEESELVHHLIELLEENSIVQIIKKDVIDPVKMHYPELHEATVQVVSKVWHTLGKDLIHQKNLAMENPMVQTSILRVIYWTVDDIHTKELLKWYLSQVIQRFMIIAPEPGTYRVGVQIPLYRPVYSLSQAVRLLWSPPSVTQKVLLSADALNPIPVDQILETYYAWMPSNLTSAIPPLNRTAVVTGCTELLTFDGTLLRAPLSPCKVLLTAVPGVASIHMSHPQSSAPPEIAFQAGQTKATVTPRMTVDINGQQVHGRQTVGDITAEVTPNHVTLTSPLVGVLVMKEERVVMVNVSGWVFNHTKGLLGSYDDERGNDRMMRNGRNATSLQELVSSWQEDPSCSTPPIRPVDPSQVPVQKNIVCDILFHMVKPCHPVVRPKAFLQRCLVYPNPFEAALSYQSLCRTKGAKLLFF